MSGQTIENELRILLGRVAKVDTAEVQLDDDLRVTLGIDSLAGLRLLAAVEKEYGVRFPDEQLVSYRTMRQILEFVADHEEENAS
jgi:acyl carrier protein